jgi:hypothetical protein
MKAAVLAAMLSVPFALAAAEVRTGDTLNEVRANLGAPHGQLKVGDRQVLYFDRGEVELRNGAVTRTNLLSDSELTALESRRAAIAARVGEENARGETLKAGKLADASFTGAPLSYQIAFWQDFARRYPGVYVAEQLRIAHLRLAEQFAEQQANEERLADLEARVSEAEARAERAEAGAYRYARYDRGYHGGVDVYPITDSSYGYGCRHNHPSPFSQVQYHFSNVLQPIVTPFNPSVVPPTYWQLTHPTGGSTGNQPCPTNLGRHGRM